MLPLKQKEKRKSQQPFHNAHRSLHSIFVLPPSDIHAASNGIGAEGASAIATAIQHCKSLATLNIGIIIS